MSLLRKVFSFSALSILGLGSMTAFAGNGSHALIPNVIGIRPAGMGQAFTAVADDQNALYYNPAGLAKLKSWSLEILNFQAAINSELLKNGMDLYDAATSGSGLSKDPASVVASFRDRFGYENSIHLGLNPYFVMHNFGFAILASEQFGLTLHGANPAIVGLESATDLDVRVGGAYSFMGDKLSVGATLVGRQRYFIGELMGFEDFQALIKETDKIQENLRKLVHSGIGAGVDVGVLFTPIEMWSPTLGISVLNVADLNFANADSSGATTAPEPIPQSVNVGVSITPRWGSWFVRGALDFRDLNLPTSAAKKPVIGFEGGFSNMLRAQLGVSEGALSAGLEIRLFVLNLRYATYATSRGYFPSQDVARMHMFGFKILL